jgi:hypothetical protein
MALANPVMAQTTRMLPQNRFFFTSLHASRLK